MSEHGVKLRNGVGLGQGEIFLLVGAVSELGEVVHPRVRQRLVARTSLPILLYDIPTLAR